ncbi:MAG: thiamine phosphate synthase [Desulfobacterales bacterium]|nr:thiamine phosphate synthase [Desulfobacterales bacterium]
MNLFQIDYSLYLVTDRGLSMGRTTLEIVEAAVHGGVTCVQLREKDCSTREFVNQALLIKDFLKLKKVPLIINDCLDVALAIGADGIHLGQSDMPFSLAKNIVGDTLVIGISAESLSDAIQAEKEGADYIGVSPIYKTPTKTDTAPPLGLKGIEEIRAVVDIPIVGIGGLNETNAREVIKSGADGVAVVSAIVSADDPETASRTLRKIIDKAKKE